LSRVDAQLLGQFRHVHFTAKLIQKGDVERFELLWFAKFNGDDEILADDLVDLVVKEIVDLLFERPK
jgi:hypothetical protein